MRPLSIPTGSVLAAVLLAGLSCAQRQWQPTAPMSPANLANATSAQGAANKFKNMVLPGREAYPRVKAMVKRLNWTGNLGVAVERARKQNKPILWIQALGDIKGYT